MEITKEEITVHIK